LIQKTFSFNLAAIMRILASSPVQVKSDSTLQGSAAPEPTVRAWLVLRHLRCLFCSPSITKLLISLSRQKAKSMAMGTAWNHCGANGLSPIHHACRTNYCIYDVHRRMLHSLLTPVYDEESFNIKNIEERDDDDGETNTNMLAAVCNL
jgi:hypothetical protein